MTNERYFLKQCTEAYAEFGSKFNELCETLITTFNDNEFNPGVRFIKENGSESISLSTLGTMFRLDFELSRIDDRNFGRLKAELDCPYEKGVVLLHYVYFDRLGNVRREPNAECEMNSLADKSFASQFLDELALSYLKYVNSRCEMALTKRTTATK